MWKVIFSPPAAKWLDKVDRRTALRVRNALRAVAVLDDPRVRGKRLSGALAGLWRYRVGDYRIICDIKDKELVILAIKIDRRDDIYR